MASKRPKKQLESSNILELEYREVGEGEGRWACPRKLCMHIVLLYGQTISNLPPTGLLQHCHFNLQPKLLDQLFSKH